MKNGELSPSSSLSLSLSSSFLIESTVGLGDLFTQSHRHQRRPDCSNCLDAGWQTDTATGHFIGCTCCTTPIHLGTGGRYLVVRVLGRGAHASTWLARDRYGGTGAMRAIKIWRDGMGEVAMNEAAWLEALSRCASTAALRLYSRLWAGPHAGLVLQVLQPVDPLMGGSGGGNTTFPMNQARLARFVHDIASQLWLLHTGLGAIHADLKIDNVMWDGEGECYKLIDYGNCLGRDQMNGLNRGFAVGIPFTGENDDREQEESSSSFYPHRPTLQSQHYRAPEVVAGLGLLDEAIDAWSLGVLMLEIVRWWRVVEGCREHGLSILSSNTPYHLWEGGSAADPEQSLLVAMTNLLGPLPDIPYRQGMDSPDYGGSVPFTSQYEEHVQKPLMATAAAGSASLVFWRHWRRSNLAALTGLREGRLLDLIVRLLEFDPKERLSMAEVLEHPFLGHLRGYCARKHEEGEVMMKVEDGQKKFNDVCTASVQTEWPEYTPQHPQPQQQQQQHLFLNNLSRPPSLNGLTTRKRSLAPKPPMTTTTKFVFINPSTPPPPLVATAVGTENSTSTLNTPTPKTLRRGDKSGRKQSTPPLVPPLEAVTIRISKAPPAKNASSTKPSERRGPSSVVRRAK